MGVSLLIPLIVIVLAGFNYINLTLTRSLSRAREVGVRKVAGAKKSQLISQFLVETIVIALLAFVLGYLGLVLLQEYIHVRWLTWEVNDTRMLWAVFVGFTLFTGFLAGILPARILSSYQPVQILKGEMAPTGLGKFGFRKTLTVIQFVVALVFMTGTGIMNSQFEYMANDNENFNRKNILNIPLVPDSDFKLLANEMSREAGVERVGLTSATLNEGAGKAKLAPLSEQNSPNRVETYIYASDRNFIENMRLQFIAGENVPASTDTTVHFVVLNQKAAQSLGWKNPREAVGQTIVLNETRVIVSGIVKNFCFMRYELPVVPLVLAYDPREIKVLSLEIAPGADRDRLAATLGKTWKKYHPHESFVYSWYEEQLYEDYLENEDQKNHGFAGLRRVHDRGDGLAGNGHLLHCQTRERSGRAKSNGCQHGADHAAVVRLICETDPDRGDYRDADRLCTWVAVSEHFYLPPQPRPRRIPDLHRQPRANRPVHNRHSDL